jgi:cell division septum initiation protein DivIVA
MAEHRFWTGDMIRSGDLPRVFFGGLDEKATRALLDELAASADASTTARMKLEGKCLQLSEQVDSLLTVVAELEAAVSEQSRKLEASRGFEERVAELERTLEERDRAAAAQPSEAELTELIRGASRTVEELLAQARSEAARVTAEASTMAERLLEDAKSDFRRTQDDVADLRRLLDETRGGLPESMKPALATQEPVELPATERGFVGGELIEDSLQPSTASEQSPFTFVVRSQDEQSDHSGSAETYGSDQPVFDDSST